MKESRNRLRLFPKVHPLTLLPRLLSGFWLRCICYALVSIPFANATANGQDQEVERKTKRKPPSELLEEIAKRFEIGVVADAPEFPIKTVHGMIEGKAAAPMAVQRYARVLHTEFGRYPPTAVRRTGLMRIILCADLSFDGQKRTAIPDFEHHTLYLDIERGSYDRNYQIQVLHHEFFHVIDYADDGLVYEDNDWASLNPSDFAYGTGGRNAQDVADTNVLTDRYPGFLNHYSTTGVEEDKAEIFARLIIDPSMVQRRAESDPVLRAKIEKMESLVRKFSDEMNEEFWEGFSKLRRVR
jgi:hypothetical protein